VTLPVERLTRRAFLSLPEYSCSQPTGVVAGKVWRANPRAYPWFWPPELRGYEWLILEYVRDGPGVCRVDIRIPEVVTP
jgi:hypothetical protein